MCEASPRTIPVVGTRVEVRVGERVMARDVTSSDSYLSCPDPRLHFGLGGAKIADRVTVRWRDGSTNGARARPRESDPDLPEGTVGWLQPREAFA